jgi:SSS family solute:Na+ symporter
MRWLDTFVVLAYLGTIALLGLRFARRQTSTERYFVAKRSVPAWAMGLSMLATLISSVTFIGYPGSAYAADWGLLVPGFMLVVVLVIVGAVIIPFYRHVVGMSAYEFFGKRFGQPARMYSSFAFSLSHFSKMGFVFYLVALTVNSMTGWGIDRVIWLVGAVTVLFTLLGGLEAVIWVDVLQSFILWAGILICLGYLLFLPPGGPAAVLSLAWANHKFSLGSLAPDLSKSTVLVTALYGFFWYLQKYTADQTIVQRYLVAKSDRQALKGVALGASLCVPVWTLFMLIGTCTWSYFKLTGEALPRHITKADQVFPYFLTAHLPPGLMGLVMACLLGAAIAMLASDLNCLAVVGVEDYYRQLKSGTTDGQRLRFGRFLVFVCGLLCVGIATILVHSQGSALSLWFTVSAVVAGGLAGLFFLAFFCTRANRRGAYVGIAASLLVTAWATLTMGGGKVLNLGRWNYPWHELTIGAISHVVLFAVGYFASFLFPAESGQSKDLTIWAWREKKRNAMLA